MKVNLDNKEYDFLIGYQKDLKKRHAFNQAVIKVFGLVFEEWYSAGYWNEKYIPYTLFDGETAVANVSVNIMDFLVFGKQQRQIQIGTVLTDEAYQHKGLCKFLMERVLEDWKNKCDLIYLFANATVLNMYPKFGFHKKNEYEYFKFIDKKVEDENFEKLNMDIQSNRDMLYDYVKSSIGFGKISMHENADLVMFYCITVLKNNIFYIKSLDVIAVATFTDDKIRVWDIFSQINIDLDKILYQLVNPRIHSIVLGFTPKNPNSYQVRALSGDDTLFIYSDKNQLFDENKIMYPLLSHA